MTTKSIDHHLRNMSISTFLFCPSCPCSLHLVRHHSCSSFWPFHKQQLWLGRLVLTLSATRPSVVTQRPRGSDCPAARHSLHTVIPLDVWRSAAGAVILPRSIQNCAQFTSVNRHNKTNLDSRRLWGCCLYIIISYVITICVLYWFSYF